MKTVIGVDVEGRYASALETCLELDFPNQEFTFVHAIEPQLELATVGQSGQASISSPLDIKEAGRAAVTKAEARACFRHVPSRSVVVDGPPATTLMTVADGQAADIIAVGYTPQEPSSAISVGKALATGAHQSLLITKSGVLPQRPLRAVFATDHSPYADRAVEKLIGWAPRGLIQIDILFVHEPGEQAWESQEPILGEAGAHVFHRKCEAIAETFKSAGYLGEVHVRRGLAKDVVAEHMASSEAHLLIAGAQGHGVLERLFVGDFALHQVVASNYTALLIRA